MTWTLKNLIIASGSSGVAGQSFRNHVTGAATGVKVSDYKGTAATWDAHTFPGFYDPNSSFQCNLTFTENLRAYLIRRRGSNQGIITMTAVSRVVMAIEQLLDPPGANFVTVVVDGVLDLSGAGISSTFNVPASPFGSPGQGGGPLTVRFIVSVNSISPTGSTFTGWNLTLPQNAIGYPFNDYVGPSGLTGQYGAEVRNKAPSITDYDFEWYNDSLFSSFFGAGSQVTFTQSFQGQDKTLWVQWRIKPALNGGDTTWHQRLTGQTFTDNR